MTELDAYERYLQGKIADAEEMLAQTEALKSCTDGSRNPAQKRVDEIRLIADEVRRSERKEALRMYKILMLGWHPGDDDPTWHQGREEDS